jgi:hypothetical protein
VSVVYNQLTFNSRCHRNTVNDIPECHLVKAMAEIYAHCQTIKSPRAKPQQRLDEFERLVTQQGTGVWMKAHDGLKADIIDTLKAEKRQLKKDMHIYFAGIEEKFNLQCVGNVVECEAETELREELRENLNQAQKLLDDEIKPGMQTCLVDPEIEE